MEGSGSRDRTAKRSQSGIPIVGQAAELAGKSSATPLIFKASARVSDRDLKGLRALADEGSAVARFLVSFDELDRRTDDGIRLLHWRTFLTALWTDALF